MGAGGQCWTGAGRGVEVVGRGQQCFGWGREGGGLNFWLNRGREARKGLVPSSSPDEGKVEEGNEKDKGTLATAERGGLDVGGERQALFYKEEDIVLQGIIHFNNYLQ
ncbi:hypothetical protein Salat_2430900 [Sesamum alatum]|uniref:Uncharacterized protein n=1 Tax=Sesamum alatum TaxID=300844 RepID=A0AAE1XY26_9LAMI|nr:hypothetical protein Salat_2430900 [Sesamum alatum]